MKNLIGLTGVLFVITANLFADQRPITGQADQMSGYRSDRIVVKVSPSIQINLQTLKTGNAPVDAIFETIRVQSIRPAYPFATHPFKFPKIAKDLGLDRYFVVSVPRGTDTRLATLSLRNFSSVFENVDIDGIGGIADEIIPNDYYFSSQWNMKNTGQIVNGITGTIGADVRASFAWSLFTGASNVTIALIDSGFQRDHQEFQGRYVQGMNVLNWDSNDTVDADCPHGTHVAGIMAAKGNNGTEGVAGMNWFAKIMPIKVLTECNGDESGTANGIIYAADQGIKIANMSLQFYQGIPYFRDAAEYGYQAGMLMVAATGNYHQPMAAFPARFPHVFGVGAVDNLGIRPLFSNFGFGLKIAAPGVFVWSTYGVNGYQVLSGTSMASPHVAGLASLLKSWKPDLTPDQMMTIMSTTANHAGLFSSEGDYGSGLMDAYAAMKKVMDPCIADFDHSYRLNVGDYMAFMNAYAAGSPDADVNHDGVLSRQDFFDFHNAYVAGCWE